MTDYRRMTAKDLREAAESGDDGAQAELDRRAERRAEKRSAGGNLPRSNGGGRF